MNDATPGNINQLLAIEWIILITVMVGGEFLLRLSPGGDLSEHTEKYFRAGHAHAGVLAGIGIALLLVLGRTTISESTVLMIWGTWLAGVLMLSGGFFYHAYLGPESGASAGTYISAVGGLLLAIAAVAVAVQLWKS